MKRIVCLLVSAFLGVGSVAYAQGELDAYKMAQTELNGTARYLGLSGAFGALGGDMSVMSTNPGGLAIYRSSEVATTISLSSIKTNSNWNGSIMNGSRTKFNFDNIAYVGYFPTGNDEGVISWNVGLSYNRVKDFNRTYRVNGAQAYSVADYAADLTYNIPERDLQLVDGGYDPYKDSNAPWLSILGYEAYFFDPDVSGGSSYHSAFGEYQGDVWSPYSPQNVDLQVNEKGSIGQYNIALATNISDRFFLGATLAITDIDYAMTTKYTEDFSTVDLLWLDNGLSTSGSGYAFNLGAVVRATDFLRLGVAYNSPTWYKMTDYFYGEAQTVINDVENPLAKTLENQAGEYHLRTPDRWIFSAAAIGPNFLLSADYELTNYKRMVLNDMIGNELPPTADIRNDFGMSGTLKVGAEYRVTPQFSVRAGTLWRTTPMKQHLIDGVSLINPETGDYFADAVVTAGTIPHYTVDRGTNSYSIGLGYRFTPNFYTDLACVLREYKEDVYMFPSTFEADGSIVVQSDASTLKTKTTQVALTLGYKF